MVDLVNKKIQELKKFLKVLEINSIEDIPTRDVITKKLKSGEYTFRDAWFAKAYDQGLDVSGAIFKDSRGLDVKEIAQHLKKNFPLRIETGQGMGGIANTITQLQNKFKSTKYNLPFLDANPISAKNFMETNEIFGGNSTQINALYGSIEQIKKGALAKKKSAGTRIFKSIPNDKIIAKILDGISDIPKQAHRELLLLNLFGTRGQQNLEMVASKEFADDVGRPFYGRESGTAFGVLVRTGRKPLAVEVPFGPFMRDMLDKRYDRMTNKGAVTYIEMWKEIPDNFDLGKLVDDYLFNDPSGKSVLSDEELIKLGREPNGFTDLRRLVLSWASKLDNPALAAELLTHGSKKAHDALDLVTNKHYIPAEGTPTEVLRNFTTRIEQRVARVLGHKTYTSFNKQMRVRKHGTYTAGVKFGTKKVVVPNKVTNITSVDDVIIDDPTSIDETNISGEEESLFDDRQKYKQASYREKTGKLNEETEERVKKNYEKNVKLDPEYTMEDARKAIQEGKFKTVEKNEMFDKISNSIDSFINKGKTQAREMVGDISNFAQGLKEKEMQKLQDAAAATDPKTPKEMAEKFLKTGFGIAAAIPSKGFKLAKGITKAVVKPSPGAVGKSEVLLDASEMFERPAILTQADENLEQQKMADIDYSMQQNESQIGDGKLPIEEQMKKFGF